MGVRRVACAAAVAALLGSPVARAAAPGEADAALALACSTCHAATTADSGIPVLRGPAARLLSELRAFRDGTRAATIMDRITRGYSDPELVRIADYIADRRDAGAGEVR